MGWPQTLTKSLSVNYLPHGSVHLWDRLLLALHVVSDSLIFLSYVSISCSLAWILYQLRRQVPWIGIFVAFGTFILACGITHAMDVVVLWTPWYWAAGGIKLITAAASVITALILPSIIPKIKRVLDASESSRKNEILLLGAAESSMDCLYFAEALRNADGEIEDFIFTYVNRNAIGLVTFPREQLLGGRMCRLFPINLKLGLFEKYQQVVLTGEPFLGEFAINEDTIHTAWLRIQAIKLGDGVAITASNITERKKQEEALRKSQAFLDRTGRLAGVGGWELNIATGELIWSEETYRIMGMDLDYTPLLEDGMNLYVPEDRPRVRAAIEKAAAGQEPCDMEATIIRTDGRRISLRVAASAEFVDGKPVRLTGSFQDITARVAEERALEVANQRLTLATDSGGIGIWDWDVMDDKVTFSPWMYRLYGMEPSDEVQTYASWLAHLHPEDVAAAGHAMQGALNDTEPVIDIAFRVLWADGSVHHLRGTGHVARDTFARPVHVIGANWDVTEQHRLAEEADRVSKLELQLKDDFISHVSHELRSPLAAIDSFSSILADGLAGETSPEQDEYLQIILRNSKQLQSMIEDLLEIAQTRTGKLRVNLTCASSSEALVDVIHTLQGAAQVKEISLSSFCPDNLPSVYADGVRLRQILIILSDNAIKFTPAGGEVKIQVCVFLEHPSFLLFEVSDTGCGISPGLKERIFEHLYQVTDSSQAGRKGLGLGLHIAKELVVRQGGEIWVISEPGAGSRFFFTLPIFSEKLSSCGEDAQEEDAQEVGVGCL